MRPRMSSLDLPTLSQCSNGAGSRITNRGEDPSILPPPPRWHRTMLRMALASSRPAMQSIPIHGSPLLLRFILRISRYIPNAVDWLLEGDPKRWTVETIQVISNNDRILDYVVWKHMFAPNVNRDVVQLVLEDSRYRHKDWQVPLRIQTRWDRFRFRSTCW